MSNSFPNARSKWSGPRGPRLGPWPACFEGRKVLLASFLFAASCAKHEEEPPKPKAIVAVKTAKLEMGSVQLSLKAPATIFPREQANITPRMTAVIR